MSSPIAIPRSNKRFSTSSVSSSSSYSSVASSSSSPATSYHSTSAPSSPTTAAKGLYVPVHKRSPSPSTKALPQTESSPTPVPSRIYSIQYLLSLRTHAHEGMKEKMRAGSAPELVMNRRMRKNLEFAEHQHKRVSPTSSVHVSPVLKSAPLPTPHVLVAPTPVPQPQTGTKTKTAKRIPSRSRTRFSGRAPASERRKQALGGLQANLASWRTAVPITPSLAVV